MVTYIKICPPKPCHCCATWKKTVLNTYLRSQVCYSGSLYPNSYHHAQIGIYSLKVKEAPLHLIQWLWWNPETLNYLVWVCVVFGDSFVCCCLFVCVFVPPSPPWMLVYPSIVTTMFLFVCPQKQLKPSICGAWGCVSNELARWCCRLAHCSLFLLLYFA